MAQGNVDVFNLHAEGKAAISEKGGMITLRAGDPVSALQAVSRQAGIKIELSPAEVERIVGAGRLDISLRYASDFSGATGTVKKIDQLAAEAFAARNLHAKEKRAVWKVLAWLLLAAVLGAAGFAVTVAVLDTTHGSRTLQRWLQ